jgi:hypothetical protein
MTPLHELKRLLGQCTPAQRAQIFRQLRKEFSIHPLESRLHTSAEIILEAIDKAGGLTLRMIRGVIAQAAFEIEVVARLPGWSNVTPKGNPPYDFLLEDKQGTVRVQVKLQRSKAGRPMRASEALCRFSSDMFVVETQKTRKGSHGSTGESTRPYRFGEFDLLAVAMFPSTNQWNTFMYTVARWLLADLTDPKRLLKFQPVVSVPNNDWTNDFLTAVRWFRSKLNKKINAIG